MHHEIGTHITPLQSPPSQGGGSGQSRWEAERTFGFTMAIVLGILQGLWWTGWYPRVHLLVWLTDLAGGPAALARGMWLVATVLAIAALVYPRILWPVNKGWLALGEGMGSLMSRVILSVVYFVVVTPIALVRRALGHDPMQRRFEPDRPSYWQPRERVPFDPRRCTRQG